MMAPQGMSLMKSLPSFKRMTFVNVQSHISPVWFPAGPKSHDPFLLSIVQIRRERKPITVFTLFELRKLEGVAPLVTDYPVLN